MIRLDFTTNNPRWGISGILFLSLEEYSFTLGFLSNLRHHYGYGNRSDASGRTKYDDSISIHIEGNYIDGAWAQECRIHFYKSDEMLRVLSALERAKSAGRGSDISWRINSNEYINHLIQDYHFRIMPGGYTNDVYPPNDIDMVWNNFMNILNISNETLEPTVIRQYFEEGWNL